MNRTFVVPPKLHDEIQTLTRDLGLESHEATIEYLLQNAIAREKKLRIVRMYRNGEKTMRQCAELLGVDLEETMDIFRDLGVEFNPDMTQQLETVRKLTRASQATMQ